MKRILWALAIIIIPAFVLWGAGSLSKRSLPYKYIGTIEGRKVPTDEFIKSAGDVRIGLFLNYFNQPEALDKFQKDISLLNRLAWENLIIKLSAKKDNVSVSDKEVVDFVTKHPIFVRGGVFDNKLYDYILANSLGISARAFEESVRDFLITAKYRAKIIENVAVSDEETRRSYKNESEKARLSYIVIDKGLFKDGVEVSKKEVTSFYEENKGRFMEPEKAVLQYIAFPHKKEGSNKEALEEIRIAYEKLRSRPLDMEKICKGLNLSVKETAPFSRGEIVREIEGVRNVSAVSFGLRPLRDVVPLTSKDEIGTSYIIRVKEIIPPRIKPENEVSSYITAVIKDEKSMKLAEEKADKLYKEAEADNKDLRKIAKENGLEFRETDLISRFDYIEGVGESYGIVTSAFESKKGELSRPIKARKGFVIMEPVEFLHIDEKKFEEEKEGYENKLLSAKKMQALQEWLTRANSHLNVDLDTL